jgi:hypothetical protein
MSELKAVSHRAADPAAQPPASPAAAPLAASAPAPPDDGWGPVRLADRYVFREPLNVQVNGEGATLFDISISGCQFVCPSAVKPNQSVKVIVPAKAPISCTGKIMWSKLEPPATGRLFGYRAGVQFTKPDQAAIEAFISALSSRA